MHKATDREWAMVVMDRLAPVDLIRDCPSRSIHLQNLFYATSTVISDRSTTHVQAWQWRLHPLQQAETLDNPGELRNSNVVEDDAGHLNQDIGYTNVQQHVHTSSNQELCSMLARRQSGGLRHPQRGKSDGECG